MVLILEGLARDVKTTETCKDGNSNLLALCRDGYETPVNSLIYS